MASPDPAAPAGGEAAAALSPEVADFGERHGLAPAVQEELQSLVNTSIAITQKRVTVCVPGTVANLGACLETCGLAVDVWDEFQVEYSDHFSVEVSGDDAKKVPQTKEHMAVVGAECAYRAAGRPFPPLRFRCTHRIPFDRGLGDGSASFIGGFLAGSVLCFEELSELSSAGQNEKLLKLIDVVSPKMRKHSSSQSLDLAGHAPPAAGDAEGGASEDATLLDHLVAHAVSQGFSLGHVCPAIFGALQVGVKTGAGHKTCRVPVPSGLVCVLFVPDKYGAGKPLPSDEMVDRKAAIHNVGRVALIINSFCSNNFGMLQQFTEDALALPHVMKEFPHMEPVSKVALEAGAACSCPCYYGPSVLALVTGRSGDIMAQSASNQLERSVAQAMLSKAEECGVPGQVLITRPADVGAHVVAQKSTLGVTGDDAGRISYFQ